MWIIVIPNFNANHWFYPDVFDLPIHCIEHATVDNGGVADRCVSSLFELTKKSTTS